MKTLREFNSLLSQHDWFYAFSDDHRVWTQGKRNEETITDLTKQSPEHLELFKLWTKFIRDLSAATFAEVENIRNSFRDTRDAFLQKHEPISPNE